jgi:hypothetical protein
MNFFRSGFVQDGAGAFKIAGEKRLKYQPKSRRSKGQNQKKKTLPNKGLW